MMKLVSDIVVGIQDHYQCNVSGVPRNDKIPDWSKHDNWTKDGKLLISLRFAGQQESCQNLQ